MALFEVPGWSIPSAPIVDPAKRSRKRKRPSGSDETQTIRSAKVNVEKLMKRLKDDGTTVPENGKKEKKKKKKGTSSRIKSLPPKTKDKDAKDSRPCSSKGKERPTTKDLQRAPSPIADEASHPTASHQHEKKRRKKRKTIDPSLPVHVSTEASIRVPSLPSPGLTTLQNNMKNSLEGARFRCVNLRTHVL